MSEQQSNVFSQIHKLKQQYAVLSCSNWAHWRQIFLNFRISFLRNIGTGGHLNAQSKKESRSVDIADITLAIHTIIQTSSHPTVYWQCNSFNQSPTTNHQSATHPLTIRSLIFMFTKHAKSKIACPFLFMLGHTFTSSLQRADLCCLQLALTRVQFTFQSFATRIQAVMWCTVTSD
jgi:hypothetical protein